MEDDSNPDSGEGEERVQPLPITAELDLHTFRPADVREVVEAYRDECQVRGILEVRIVHGKGRGELMRTVHSLLARRVDVASFALATPLFGGPGATFVHLKSPGDDSHSRIAQ